MNFIPSNGRLVTRCRLCRKHMFAGADDAETRQAIAQLEHAGIGGMVCDRCVPPPRLDAADDLALFIDELEASGTPVTVLHLD